MTITGEKGENQMQIFLVRGKGKNIKVRKARGKEGNFEPSVKMARWRPLEFMWRAASCLQMWGILLFLSISINSVQMSAFFIFHGGGLIDISGSCIIMSVGWSSLLARVGNGAVPSDPSVFQYTSFLLKSSLVGDRLLINLALVFIAIRSRCSANDGSPLSTLSDSTGDDRNAPVTSLSPSFWIDSSLCKLVFVADP